MIIIFFYFFWGGGGGGGGGPCFEQEFKRKCAIEKQKRRKFEFK